MSTDLTRPPDSALLDANDHVAWPDAVLIVPRWWDGSQPLEPSVDRVSLRRLRVPADLVEAVRGAAALQDGPERARIDLWVCPAPARVGVPVLLALQVRPTGFRRVVADAHPPLP